MSDYSELLSARIINDFPTAPIPEKISKETAECYVNAYFSNRSWRDVSARSILTAGGGDHGTYLHDITYEAFQYYLPAYMLMCLNEYNDETAWIAETVFWQLLPPDNLSSQEGDKPECKFVERFCKFTDAQKRDIADFLAHQSHHLGKEYIPSYTNDRALSAYNSYWHQFATPLAGANSPLPTP